MMKRSGFCSLSILLMSTVSANHATMQSPFNTTMDLMHQKIARQYQATQSAALPTPNFADLSAALKIPSPELKNQTDVAIPTPALKPKTDVAIPTPALKPQTDAPVPTPALKPIPAPETKLDTNDDDMTKPFVRPELKWQVSASSGGNATTAFAPVVIGDRVFATGANGVITALDANTGKRLWQVETQLPVTTALAATDKHVFAGTDNGLLLAIDADKQKLAYQKQLSSSVLAPPVSADATTVFAKTLDDHIYAFEAANGHVLWAYSQKAPALTNRQSSAPILAGDKLIAGLASGKVVAIDRKKGTPLWEQQLSYGDGNSDLGNMVDIDIPPVVADDQVYAANIKGDIAAYKLDSGQPVWQQKGDPIKGMVAINNSLIVFYDDGKIAALTPDFGSVKWHNENYKGKAPTPPAIQQGKIVFADDKGRVHWLQPEDGEEVASLGVGKQAFSAAPRVIGQALYLQTQSGKVLKIQ